MLKEPFMGHHPSHFHVNPLIKAYIISECLLWSGWNFVTPIFSVFVVNSIHGGSIQAAAGGYSVYLITRVLWELISGKYLTKATDKKKMLVTIIGLLYISLAYAGFAFSQSVLQIFFFYAIAGMGLGVASPAKNTIFAVHLDKNKEASEWSISDATSFICMALATALGGFIVSFYGFHALFLLACLINILSIIPYAIFLK